MNKITMRSVNTQGIKAGLVCSSCRSTVIVDNYAQILKS